VFRCVLCGEWMFYFGFILRGKGRSVKEKGRGGLATAPSRSRRKVDGLRETRSAETVCRAQGEGGRDAVPAGIVIELARIDVGYIAAFARHQIALLHFEHTTVVRPEGIQDVGCRGGCRIVRCHDADGFPGDASSVGDRETEGILPTMRMDSQVTPPVLVIEKRKAYCGAQFVIPR